MHALLCFEIRTTLQTVGKTVGIVRVMQSTGQAHVLKIYQSLFIYECTDFNVEINLDQPKSYVFTDHKTRRSISLLITRTRASLLA